MVRLIIAIILGSLILGCASDTVVRTSIDYHITDDLSVSTLVLSNY